MKLASIVLAFSLSFPVTALADAVQQFEHPQCQSSDRMMKSLPAMHAKWQSLNDAQWNFVRGIYAVDPNTPPGLPIGDHAGLITDDSHPGGLLVFMDGDLICGRGLPLPDALIELLATVGSGIVEHGAENDPL